jgi:hypothetical protein
MQTWQADVLEFATELVLQMDFGANAARVGLVEFDDESTILSNLTHNTTAMLAAMANAQQAQGWTSISSGLAAGLAVLTVRVHHGRHGYGPRPLSRTVLLVGHLPTRPASSVTAPGAALDASDLLEHVPLRWRRLVQRRRPRLRVLILRVRHRLRRLRPPPLASVAASSATISIKPAG